MEIDEFGYAAQVEAVARLAVEISKTARKYGCGMVLVDQNPLTFLESESGRQIYENATARILFHLDDMAARQIGAAMSDLTPEHIAFLPQAQPGECLAVIKNDVYRLAVVAICDLGRSFGIIAAHRGIQTGGLYQYVRHLIYAAYLLAFGGFVLAHPSIHNGVVLLVWTGIQIARIHAEERLLSAGPYYVAYAERVRHRLIPRIW